MTTRAPHEVYRIFELVDPYLKTVKMGGVVGDAKHGSGYHLSPEDLDNRGLGDTDYSLRCPADKRGRKLGGGEYAAAIDLTFGSLDELILVTKRLRSACEADDPRVEALREHIGTVNGKTVSGYNRVATGSGSRSIVGWHASGFSDSSHLWHAHLSILRDRVEDANLMRGLAEVIAGLPSGKLGYKSTTGTTNPTTPAAPAEDEDEVTPADRKAIVDDVVARLKKELPPAIWSFDGIPAPVGASEEDRKRNPHWTPSSFLRRIDAALTRIGGGK